MEKIVIGTNEIADIGVIPDSPVALTPRLGPPVSIWAKVAMSPLVLLLPVLCLVTLAMRMATRGLPPRTRQAWLEFLSSLLIVSGLLGTAVAVIAIAAANSRAAIENIADATDLDSRTAYPVLPALMPLSAKDVAERLRPLVVVISPARSSWFKAGVSPSDSFGAGVLLAADNQGYLIMTARHVVGNAGGSGDRVLVATQSGTWSSGDVIARHTSLDLALIWLPRRSGTGAFVIPVRGRSSVSEGESIFVIGHPQGLRFTLSTGIVSRKTEDALQISAPVSPGNSGGPAFDDHGNLVGIVTSMVDRNSNPNAENLNFAVSADAALQTTGWQFIKQGSVRLQAFLRVRPL